MNNNETVNDQDRSTKGVSDAVELSGAEELMQAAERAAKHELVMRDKRFKALKEEMVGKEQFDVRALIALRSLTDGSEPYLKADQIEELERRYYLDCGELKTLQEFAEYLDDLERNNAG